MIYGFYIWIYISGRTEKISGALFEKECARRRKFLSGQMHPCYPTVLLAPITTQEPYPTPSPPLYFSLLQPIQPRSPPLPVNMFMSTCRYIEVDNEYFTSIDNLYDIFMARLTVVTGPYRFCPVRACIFCFHRKWYLWVSKRLLV